jgi:hypothetical protein
MNSATASLADPKDIFLFGRWFVALFGRWFVALFGRWFVALFGRWFKVRVQNLVTSFQPNPGGSPGQ